MIQTEWQQRKPPNTAFFPFRNTKKHSNVLPLIPALIIIEPIVD
jgi:4-amino-4-deoxy-L-arabinose transferase-like glycosyltransferase